MTDRIFVREFLLSKEEPGISFSQRETEDMLFSILKCLDSMLLTPDLFRASTIFMNSVYRFKDR